VTLVSDPEVMSPTLQQQIAALTLNNLGCMYKKNGRNKVALNYMVAALEKEESCQACSSQVAGTQLNICAILSQMGDHTASINFCINSIQNLMACLKLIEIKTISDKAHQAYVLHRENLTRSSLAAIDPLIEPCVRRTLSIAYFNLACEYEYVKEFENALNSLSKSRLHCHDDDSLLGQIERTSKQIRTKLKRQLEKYDRNKKPIVLRSEQVKMGIPNNFVITASKNKDAKSSPSRSPFKQQSSLLKKHSPKKNSRYGFRLA